ncbi:MAG TPA: hypothetical protein VLY04_17845 [Bryobacteraceae bacterium]|nr:hypothetical protein [Bryobacteraceae bacterium]
MKRAVIIIILGSCWLAAAAFPAETPAERGKRVVYEALQALGGDAFLHMTDRVESGRAYSFYREQISGLSIAKIYTRYLAPVPGVAAVSEREAFGLKEDSSVLLTPDGAWDVTYRGARPLDDQTYARYKETTLRNVLYILRQRLSEPGLAFYSQGTDLFEFHPVEIVDITDSRDITVTVYFDQRSKLPVHQTSRRRNEQFKDFDTEVTNYGLYRDVGHGVKWPFNIRRERNGEKIFEMFSDDVQINKDLTDDLFTLAGNIKILPKAK